MAGECLYGVFGTQNKLRKLSFAQQANKLRQLPESLNLTVVSL